MKNYLLLSVIFIAGVFFTSCNEWDDHYKQTGATGTSSDKSIYDYLIEIPEYSEFMALMDKTGVAEELKKNQILTVWVVNNDNMPDDILDIYTDPTELKRQALQHVNYTSLPSNKFAVNKMIKTLAKKNIRFTKTVLGEFALDGKAILEGKTDQMCLNGVVNELKELIIPRDNLYEVISKLPDSYSMLRDTILSYSDTLFDEDNSFPLGVDEFGNTIYDSVFVIENPYFNNAGDFRNENGEYTFFKYSNDVINSALNITYNEFGGAAGKAGLTDVEVAYINQWVMRAFLYKDYAFDYYRNEELTSFYGTLWKTSVQKVVGLPVPVYQRGSNVVVYDVSLLHIPRNLLLDDITYLISDIKVGGVITKGMWTLSNDEQRAQYFKYTAATAASPVTLTPVVSGAGDYWWWLSQSNSDNSITNPLTATFTVVGLDKNGNVQPVRFFPGTYDVEVAMRPYGAGSYDVYFNGVKKASNSAASNFGASTSAVGYAKPSLTDGTGKLVVTTAGNMEIKMEQIAVANTTTFERRIIINGWRFYPNKTIY